MEKQIFVFILALISYSGMACTGGTSGGTLSPAPAYQTVAVNSGQYFVINVTCGSTYNFTFCSNGGTAGWDTQITVNQTDNVTQLAYNDDFCGLQSNVSWTATFTGTIHVLVSQYSCVNSGAVSGTLAYNVTPTSVSYNASCSSANPVISGATGGTFAFSPLPGDGALINSSTGVITNATQGASYNVNYTYCGGTISTSVTMGSPPCFTLNGNAQYIDINGEPCIQLTAEINDQTGCAWNDSQIDFASDFTLSLDYYFGNNINGADGNTFTFQPSSSTACGQNGGQLGAGGIANALSIEFDTYDNDYPTHTYDMGCDHIAVEIDGNLNGPGAPLCGPVCAKAGGGNIDDGGTYGVDIVWDASAQQLQIYFDGVLRLSCTNNFITNAFGGNNLVYWGATSATGGLNNQQYFCPSTIIILPVELTSFQNSCDGTSEIFTWSTATENRTDYFQLEYTYNGTIFYPAGVVDAAGTSSIPQQYSLKIDTEDTQQRYYRLKITDENGEIEYTDLIAGKRCAFPDDLITTVTQDGSVLVIATLEQSRVRVLNAIGQEIFNGTTSGNLITLDAGTLSSGVYFIQAVSPDGRQESRKVFIR